MSLVSCEAGEFVRCRGEQPFFSLGVIALWVFVSRDSGKQLFSIVVPTCNTPVTLPSSVVDPVAHEPVHRGAFYIP